MEKIIDKIYYIKENGVTRRVTKEEYDEFMKNKEPLCPGCNQSFCEKHRTKDLNIEKCESIIDGSYSALVKEKREHYYVYSEEKRRIVRYRDEIYSFAYNCNEYKPDRDKLISDQKKNLAEPIIQLESNIIAMLELIISKESESEKEELRNEVIEVIRQIEVLEKQITFEKVHEYLENKHKAMRRTYKSKNGDDKYEQIRKEERIIFEIIEKSNNVDNQNKSLNMTNNDQK